MKNKRRENDKQRFGELSYVTRMRGSTGCGSIGLHYSVIGLHRGSIGLHSTDSRGRDLSSKTVTWSRCSQVQHCLSLFLWHVGLLQ